MIAETLAQFNFLDIVILIVLLRICYISAKMGLSIEIFKLGGTLFATYMALHYYTALSDMVHTRFIPKVMPIAFLDFLIFVLLITASYLCFVGIRSMLFRFVQLNAVPKINQFGGLLLGFLRGFLIIGLLSFALGICTVNYLTNATRRSYLASRAINISPGVYDWLWSNFVSKFSVHEKINPTITEAMEKFRGE